VMADLDVRMTVSSISLRYSMPNPRFSSPAARANRLRLADRLKSHWLVLVEEADDDPNERAAADLPGNHHRTD